MSKGNKNLQVRRNWHYLSASSRLPTWWICQPSPWVCAQSHLHLDRNTIACVLYCSILSDTDDISAGWSAINPWLIIAKLALFARCTAAFFVLLKIALSIFFYKAVIRETWSEGIKLDFPRCAPWTLQSIQVVIPPGSSAISASLLPTLMCSLGNKCVHLPGTCCLHLIPTPWGHIGFNS